MVSERSEGRGERRRRKEFENSRRSEIRFGNEGVEKKSTGVLDSLQSDESLSGDSLELSEDCEREKEEGSASRQNWSRFPSVMFSQPVTARLNDTLTGLDSSKPISFPLLQRLQTLLDNLLHPRPRSIQLPDRQPITRLDGLSILPRLDVRWKLRSGGES